MSRKGIYMIPSESEVKDAIIEVLEDYGMIGSLTSLTSLVNMRLSSENPAWRVSQRRVKKIAAYSGKVRMEISYSERDEAMHEPLCIVCSAKMEPVMNRTLYGDTVTLGYVCPKCGYKTGLKRRVPVRYSFRIR